MPNSIGVNVSVFSDFLQGFVSFETILVAFVSLCRKPCLKFP